MKGLIIGGEYSSILVRQKNEQNIEIGELLIADTVQGKVLLQAFDLVYGSQMTQQNLELVSGIKLEEDETVGVMDTKIRNYLLAKLKNLAYIEKGKVKSCKILPNFFSEVREVSKEDLDFLVEPENQLEIGKLRSGSKTLDVPIILDGKKAFSHHLLVSGTTGRGKSVLITTILQKITSKNYCGMLVLDPHDEYRERLNDVVYYSPTTKRGATTLKINIEKLQPRHFDGAIEWSDPQRQAIGAYYNEYKKDWIKAIVTDKQVRSSFYDATISVVKRNMLNLLRLSVNENGEIYSQGVFDTHAGETTIKDIINELEKGKTTIIDTSSFHGNQEILIGSMISHSILDHYKKYSTEELLQKPVISIVIEEAPRVLGREVLERGPNVFSTIAREGRKFNVGLTAITQMPSLIPRQILANMNTKIILGTELKPERQALIESAAQDLSDHDRMIASMDRGEAIITSNFLSFATPVKIERQQLKKEEKKYAYTGIKMEQK